MLNFLRRFGLGLFAMLLVADFLAARPDALAAPKHVEVPATVSFPASPLGRRVGAYFDAFNSGNVGRMKQFFETNFTAASLAERPIADRLDFYRQMRQMDGHFVVGRVIEEKDGTLTVFAKNAGGEWRRFGFQAEPGSERLLLGLRVEESQPPPGETTAAALPQDPPKATDAEAAAAADAFATELAARDEFSGAVLLARNGEPFLKRGYGLANREWGIPNSPDTKFNIGSMNKIFTTVAIAQLASSGRLSLDDTIRKWLPDYGASYADRVTLRQLLSMRSGMGDFFNPKFDGTPAGRVRGLRDYLPFFENDPLLFEPGTGQEYSNAGFLVLGLIVEKASGEDYYDYVRNHIFEPAGMRDTASFELDEVVPRRAEGYTKRGPRQVAAGGTLSKSILSLPGRGSSAGGGYSTVDDLLLFDRALISNKLLPPEWSAWVWSDKQGTPRPGGSDSKLSGGHGFAGGSPGTNGVMFVNFDSGATLIVLSNFDPPSAESLERKIRAWLPR